jgi:hypothetical protein
MGKMLTDGSPVLPLADGLIRPVAEPIPPRAPGPLKPFGVFQVCAPEISYPYPLVCRGFNLSILEDSCRASDSSKWLVGMGPYASN